MATEKAVVTQQYLTDIADAIRAKGGTSDQLLPSQMAGAIEAIPSGGGDDLFKQYVTKTMEEFDAAKILGYDATDPAITANQHMFNSYGNLKTIYAPMIGASAYFAQSCKALETVTLRGTANRVDVFSGCSALRDLTLKTNLSNTILLYTSFLSGVNQLCVIHCSDKDVKYIDGAWTAVERS